MLLEQNTDYFMQVVNVHHFQVIPVTQYSWNSSLVSLFTLKNVDARVNKTVLLRTFPFSRDILILRSCHLHKSEYLTRKPFLLDVEVAIYRATNVFTRPEVSITLTIRLFLLSTVSNWWSHHNQRLLIEIS